MITQDLNIKNQSEDQTKKEVTLMNRSELIHVYGSDTDTWLWHYITPPRT